MSFLMKKTILKTPFQPKSPWNACFDFFNCACLKKTTIDIQSSKFNTSKLMSYQGHCLCPPKSLYRSPAVRHFYGTENVIWAGFEPVGNKEKTLDRLWATFECGFFMFFYGQKKCLIFFLNIVASALKRCIISLL